MGKVITLSGVRMGAELPPEEPGPIGGGCGPTGGVTITYGGASHCVYPAYHYDEGCAAEGLVRAIEQGNLEAAKANDHMYLCVERAAIGAMTNKGPLVEVDAQGNPVVFVGPGGQPPVGGDCQAVPDCVTKKYLIATGIGAGVGLLVGLLASKRTDVRLVLTGAGAAGGVLARTWMGLGRV